MRIGRGIWPIRTLPDIIRALEYGHGHALGLGESGFDPAITLGVYWQIDPPKRDELALPSEVLARGYGDCEDLTLALGLRLAELGMPFAYAAQEAPGYGGHALIATPYGLRDPSVELLNQGRARLEPLA